VAAPLRGWRLANVSFRPTPGDGRQSSSPGRRSMLPLDDAAVEEGLRHLDNHLLDYDATLVRYRAPTEPGSSSSPVFNKRWAVIALHHSGDREMPKLHGDGVDEANEGIDQIQDALQHEP
jgi:hypothetical protein